MQALILAIIRTMETTSARRERLSREHAQRQHRQAQAQAQHRQAQAMARDHRNPYPFHS